MAEGSSVYFTFCFNVLNSSLTDWIIKVYRVYVVQSATGSSPVGRYCESDHGRSPGNGKRTSGCASYCESVVV